MSASLEAQGTLSLPPEILLLETGGRPSLDVVFVAVCDAVLRALKGERRSPLPTSLSGSASARLTQNQAAEMSSPDSKVRRGYEMATSINAEPITRMDGAGRAIITTFGSNLVQPGDARLMEDTSGRGHTHQELSPVTHAVVGMND